MMCSTVCYVLAVCVVVCVVHLTPADSQCTTKYCLDGDDDDDDSSSLKAMIYHVRDSAEQQQKEFQDSLQQQQKQYEELHQQFNESMQRLQQQMTALKRRLPPRDCYDILEEGHTDSGVYDIYLETAKTPIEVYCDMDTDGGGWTVFQRRQDGSVDFWRDWATYKKGFGDVSGEFWLGNDNIHVLTSERNYTLRVDMEDFEGETRYATYTSFDVAPESDNYRLSLGSYNGTAGDSFGCHSGKMFSTKDRDHDTYPGMNCARSVRGAWWYGRCFQVSMNGQYLHGQYTSFYNGVAWSKFRGVKYSLKKVDMKLRKQQTCSNSAEC